MKDTKGTLKKSRRNRQKHGRKKKLRKDKTEYYIENKD